MILLIIGLLFIGYALYPLVRKNPAASKHQDGVEVSLVELSSLWTKFNEAIEPIVVHDALQADELEELKKLQEEELADTIGEGETSGVVHQQPVTPAVAQEASSATVEQEKPAQVIKEPAKPVTPVVNVAATSPTSSNNSINGFIKSFISPYKHIFDQQKVFDVVSNLLEILQKHGDVPSVVLDNKDIEAINLISVKDNLARTNLKEHSCLVGILLVNMVKDCYGNQADQHIPKAVIGALAHDIGKIPEYRLTGIYNTTEHPQVSSHKLNELFFGKDVFWAKDLLKSVSEHHVPSVQDQFTQLLQNADRQARQQELLKYAKDFSILTLKDWFKPGEFIDKLEPYINVSQGNKWQAFSFNGTFYCKPDTIYEICKKMCKEKKILDISFVYEAEKEQVIRNILELLRAEGYVSEVLKVGILGMKFEILTKVGENFKYMLVPLKSEQLMSKLADIERRKIGFFDIISSVQPKNTENQKKY